MTQLVSPFRHELMIYLMLYDIKMEHDTHGTRNENTPRRAVD